MIRIPRVEPRPGRKKQCNNCREWLPIESFSRDRTGSDGRRGSCRACVSEIRRGVRDPIRSHQRLITWNGKSQSLLAWCAELGVSRHYKAIHLRIQRRYWDPIVALTTPVKRGGFVKRAA